MILSFISCVAEVAGQVAKTSSATEWIDVIAKIIIGLAGLGWAGNFLIERFHRKDVVKKYRVFLAYAAWALQDRIWSIITKPNLPHYFEEIEENEPKGVYATNALNYTVFLFCQFFAWWEITNREMYYFRFRRRNFDSKVLNKIIEIEHWFSTTTDEKLGMNLKDANIRKFLIFKGEQRVLGDMCIEPNTATKSLECICFSDFIEKMKNTDNKNCHLSLDELRNNVRDLLIDKRDNDSFDHKKYRRLVFVQHSLIDLLEILEPKKGGVRSHQKDKLKKINI